MLVLTSINEGHRNCLDAHGGDESRQSPDTTNERCRHGRQGLDEGSAGKCQFVIGTVVDESTYD